MHQPLSRFHFSKPWGRWGSGVSTLHCDCLQPHLPAWWRANCLTGWLTYNCLPHGICACFSKRSPPLMLPPFGPRLCRTYTFVCVSLPYQTAVWHSTNFSLFKASRCFQNLQILWGLIRREWWFSYHFTLMAFYCHMANVALHFNGILYTIWALRINHSLYISWYGMSPKQKVQTVQNLKSLCNYYT